MIWMTIMNRTWIRIRISIRLTIKLGFWIRLERANNLWYFVTILNTNLSTGDALLTSIPDQVNNQSTAPFVCAAQCALVFRLPSLDKSLKQLLKQLQILPQADFELLTFVWLVRMSDVHSELSSPSISLFVARPRHVGIQWLVYK